MTLPCRVFLLANHHFEIHCWPFPSPSLSLGKYNDFNNSIKEKQKHRVGQRKGNVCPSVEREIAALAPQGAAVCGQKSPPQVPDWPVLMQIRNPNLCCLIGPKGFVLISQNGGALISQLRCCGVSCAALIGWGKPHSDWLKQDPRSSS